jgi:hypothetical protein
MPKFYGPKPSLKRIPLPSQERGRAAAVATIKARRAKLMKEWERRKEVRRAYYERKLEIAE